METSVHGQTIVICVGLFIDGLESCVRRQEVETKNGTC